MSKNPQYVHDGDSVFVLMHNGNYLHAEGGRVGAKYQHRHRGGWQEFRIENRTNGGPVWSGHKVWLFNVSSGKYLHIEPSSKVGEATTEHNHFGGWQEFEIFTHEGGPVQWNQSVFLKNTTTGNYIHADNEDQVVATYPDNHLGGWQNLYFHKAEDSPKVYRIQNLANNLFVEVAFDGEFKNLQSGSNSTLVINPASNSWRQRFLYDGTHLVNEASGFRIHHGNQDVKEPFSCMVNPTEENHQKWEFKNSCFISELDGKGLTVTANDAGSQVVIRPFDVENPPSDCKWQLVEI